MRIALVAAVLLAGCDFDIPPSIGESCTESRDRCVCLEPPGICVECTVDDERNCGGATPQCGSDNRCRGCRADDECASSACLEDGTCADASRVIYARSGGVNAAGCGLAPGDNECSLEQALLEVAGERNIIRAAPGTYSVTGVDGLDFARSATLIARGSTLRRGATTGQLATVQAGQTLKLVGGTLLGPNDDDGLQCRTGGRLEVHEATIEGITQSGIESESCELTVSRSTIRNNLLGGIHMMGSPVRVAITNNFVYRNGGTVSPIGGMLLLVAAGSRVELNTVVDNTAELSMSSAGGIRCEGSSDAPFNLVYRNVGGLGGQIQVTGACTFAGSYQGAAGSPTENAVGFEDPNAARPSYRLTSSTPAPGIRDAFDCGDIAVDFEADARPQPEGGKCDLGADEYRTGQ